MNTSERLRAAIAENPNQLTLLLARKFEVPEVEVIRAFPAERACELDLARWEELVRGFEALGKVHVILSNGAATLEAVGQFGGFSTTGQFFNVQTDSLDMHIRWQQLGAIFAVQKPSHMDGQSTYSFQFFDGQGNSTFKVFLGMGGPIDPQIASYFAQLRTNYCQK